MDSGPEEGFFHAGFVSFPDLAVVRDSSAPANPAFYDRAFNKWLTVPRESVSPDGRRYAYTQGNITDNKTSKVHVVDVSTGADTVIATSTSFDAVVDFATEGIYLTKAELDTYPVGLWVLKPAGGTARLISGRILVPSVGGGAAWGLDFNPADPNPPNVGLLSSQNRVLRYDLSTGDAAPWFYRPGADVTVVGFDQLGQPLVSSSFRARPITAASAYRQELDLLLSPTAAAMVDYWTSESLPIPNPGRVLALDRHGVWFDAPRDEGLSAVWLYQEGSFQSVADEGSFHSVARFNKFVEVAGGCIP